MFRVKTEGANAEANAVMIGIAPKYKDKNETVMYCKYKTISFNCNNGHIYRDNSSYEYYSKVEAGKYVDVCVDLDEGSVFFKVEGSDQCEIQISNNENIKTLEWFLTVSLHSQNDMATIINPPEQYQAP